MALTTFLKDAKLYGIEYCSYVELRRPIFREDQSFTAGEFDVLTRSGQTGVNYFPPNALANDISEGS